MVSPIPTRGLPRSGSTVGRDWGDPLSPAPPGSRCGTHLQLCCHATTRTCRVPSRDVPVDAVKRQLSLRARHGHHAVVQVIGAFPQSVGVAVVTLDSSRVLIHDQVCMHSWNLAVDEQLLAPVVRRGAGPVSYTHLRAHETVL